jgi:AraC-like DNA-binding protein
VLRPAIDHISRHYDADIDLDLLASLCCLSTSHLIRCFKRLANCTPHEYLLAYRLRQSKQLLLTTALSIDQIAERCGFNSASHFARAFRSENGISPSEFRSIRF